MVNFVSPFEKWGRQRCRFRPSWHYSVLCVVSYNSFDLWVWICSLLGKKLYNFVDPPTWNSTTNIAIPFKYHVNHTDFPHFTFFFQVELASRWATSTSRRTWNLSKMHCHFTLKPRMHSSRTLLPHKTNKVCPILFNWKLQIYVMFCLPH